MIEIPSDIRSHDLSQWLEGGVFFAKRSADSEWELATYIGSDEARIVVRFLKDRQREDVRLSDIRCHWPRCGSVNMPGFALYVQRMQRRQWRRTYNGRCIRLSIPGKWQHLKMVTARDLRVSADDPVFLDAVFNPTYPDTFGAAVDLLRDKPSVALSPQIILVGHPNTLVYYRGERVGQMVGSKFQPECGEMTALRVGKLIGVAA